MTKLSDSSTQCTKSKETWLQGDTNLVRCVTARVALACSSNQAAVALENVGCICWKGSTSTKQEVFFITNIE